METLERKEAASAALTERSYAQIFGNKTKQAVLDFLSANAKKGYSVLDMHNTLSIPESTLSINLTELSRLGIVTFQKEGKYKYYRLAQRCVPVFRSVFHSLNQAVSCTADEKESGTAGKKASADAFGLRTTFQRKGEAKR